MNETAITIIGLLLLTGAMAKSAQIPLHSWLPGSMEGFNGVKHYFLIIIFILGFYNYLTDLSDIKYLSVLSIIPFGS
jgi:formate hydrogenlyase subunit 3/multisubunit Na+/H+ antiporter MnhD subunit